ncbi:CAP domain-containing protein [Streptomyces rimosus]
MAGRETTASEPQGRTAGRRTTASGRCGRAAGQRTGWYAVRALVALLVLAGLMVGSRALATPPDGRTVAIPPDVRAVAAPPGGDTLAAPPGASLAAHDVQAAHAAARLPRNVEATRQAVIRLVNRERARAGCRPVRSHRTVTEAAQRHSGHMARDDSLSHRERGGSGPGNRLSAVGYDWRRAGEDIARGQRGAAEVVRDWVRSPEHRVVLTDCAFRHAGVGIDTGTDGRGPWWTLLLAVPS